MVSPLQIQLNCEKKIEIKMNIKQANLLNNYVYITNCDKYNYIDNKKEEIIFIEL